MMMTKPLALAFSAFLVLAAATPAIRGSRAGYLTDQATVDAALKATEPLPQYSTLDETGDGGGCTLPSAQDAWAMVSKNDDGRVDSQAFSDFAHSVVNDDSADFNTYVDDLFTAGVSMMLPNVKTDLGSHCFGEISKLFKECDPNGNGYLSLAEIDKAVVTGTLLSADFDYKPVLMRAYKVGARTRRRPARQPSCRSRRHPAPPGP